MGLSPMMECDPWAVASTVATLGTITVCASSSMFACTASVRPSLSSFSNATMDLPARAEASKAKRTVAVPEAAAAVNCACTVMGLPSLPKSSEELALSIRVPVSV